ncbi:MAG: 6-phosphogluconate dehydrogenase (decarboxylating) [Candidatus Moduliflexus flocculans]|nr:6-phosphogluconate dehydrogenase (decarboxylating) [Candidatus Moduliflexus flocculans]
MQALAGEKGDRRLLARRFRRASSRKPRAVWLMVPAAVGRRDASPTSLPLLDAGRHPHRRRQLRTTSTTSAAPRSCARRASTTSTSARAAASGACERGYCLMIGGETDVVAAPRPDLRRAGPGHRRRRRARPAASEAGGTAEQGYLHCGPNGAGHFVKMVHNGIEYGLMAAYAEGFNILRARQRRQADARASTPRRRRCAIPSTTSYDLDLRRHRRGVAARQRDRLVAARPDRGRARRATRRSANFAGRVSDSGEGRWTIKAAIDEGVPAPRAHRRALRALQLARRSGLPEPAAVRHALPVRGTHREAIRQVTIGDAGDRERACAD